MAVASGATIAFSLFYFVCDILLRRLAGVSIPGTLDFGGFFMVMIVFFGIPYAQKVGGHMRLVVVLERLPVKAQKYANLVTGMIVASTAAVLTYRTFIYAWDAWRSKDVAWVAGLDLPLWPIQAIAPFGMGVLAIELLTELVRGFRAESREGGDQELKLI